jgi:hypothetical protein
LGRNLEQIPDENSQLTKLLAELNLDKAVLQDVLATLSPARAKKHRGELRHEPSLILDQKIKAHRKASFCRHFVARKT